jgi:hypothetical protein
MPGSNSRWPNLLANGLSILALILALVIVFEGVQNRSLQDKVNAGHSELAKAQALANLDNNLIQLLAKTAADKNDGALQGLLARNGVTFRTDSAHAAPAAPAAPSDGNSQ